MNVHEYLLLLFLRWKSIQTNGNQILESSEEYNLCPLSAN